MSQKLENTAKTGRRIAAVVVTYNRKELLGECLDALDKQTAASQMDILVIDNASTDGTKAMIESREPSDRLRYFNTGSNLGGAGGFSFGMRAAVEQGYELLWLMDDDCIPHENALEELLAAADVLPEPWGFLASRVEWTDGSLCRMNEVKLVQPPRESHGYPLCRQASFVSLFVPAAIVRDAGLPLKEFFIWGDDVEYTRRISAMYASFYVPQSVVAHKTKNNAGSDISRDSVERLERYRYAYRNEVYIARQEGISRKAYQVAKVMLHLARVAAFAKSEKKRRAAIILSSSLEGFTFNPTVEYPIAEGDAHAVSQS